jgi:cell wall-associated NlpC family hydrolase
MRNLLSLTLLAALFVAGCSATAPSAPDPLAGLMAPPPAGPADYALRDMGYAIQVGAFAEIGNAARLEQSLNLRGIDAFYFLQDGLYKVRFGNHANDNDARRQAYTLQAQGLIGDYFIVFPEDYTTARIRRSGQGDLRTELVATAKSFIGTPYRWGGTSAEQGFDCSGLTLVSYRLNGLDLPRVSYHQYAAGRPVSRQKLQQGDLVFFATRGGNQVSHVGMYIGGGRFIHAPRSGQTVRTENLSNSYYQRTFVGARTYL